MTKTRLVTVDADWPAPPHVRALTTTRAGGVSESPYASLNLATHVGDDPARVGVNRARLLAALHLPSGPIWLDQHHGTNVIDAHRDSDRHADGSRTTEPRIVCAILTADCLPIVLTDRAGTEIAALHAGWRGLAAGIIAAGIGRMRTSPADLLAWLGPAVSAAHYEVGAEVYETFIGHAPALVSAFAPTRPGHYRCDLYMIARALLGAAGVTAVYGGEYCTHRDVERFFSYRRDGGNGRETGRIATLAWMEPTVSQPAILPRK